MKPYRLISFFLLAVLAACRPDDPVVPQEIQAPFGVKCETATQTTLVFSWNEVDGADYYVARLEKADGTLVSGGQTTTRETSIRYDGLTPETAYSFKVRVRADDMDSPYSAALSASTLKPGEEPEPGPIPILSLRLMNIMLSSRFRVMKMLTGRLLRSLALKEAECSLQEDAEERSYTSPTLMIQVRALSAPLLRSPVRGRSYSMWLES